MAKTIILKNATTTEVKIGSLGLIIAGSQMAYCEYEDILSLEDSTELPTLINAGTIVVNNGTSDLTKTDALVYVSVGASVTANFYNKGEVDAKVTAQVAAAVNPLSSTLTSNYYDKAGVDTKIAAIQSYGINGAVDYYDQLPSSSNKLGDIWIVRRTKAAGTSPTAFVVDGQTSLYLPFDTTWRDTLGHAGTQYGTIDLVNGVINKAGDFNGSSDAIVFNASSDFGSTPSLTVGGWLYTRKTGSYGIISRWSNASGDGQGWKIEVESNRVRVYLDALNGEYSGWSVVEDSNNLSLNLWTHVAFTYDNGILILYINGTPVNSVQSYVGPVDEPSTPLYVGRTEDGNSSKYLNGLMDDWFIENRVMSRGEIESLIYGVIGNYIYEGFYRWSGTEWEFLSRNTGTDAATISHNSLIGLNSGDMQHMTLDERNTLLGGSTTDAHNHDSRYYTETEVNTNFAAKNHNHDSSYYTKAQTDSVIADITYSTISTNDPNTNITGAELEILSNGSNADGLHTHNFASLIDGKGLDDAYDNHSPYQPGVGRGITVDSGAVTLTASDGYAPLKLTTINYTPNKDMSGGEICYYDGDLFGYDAIRGKWLMISGISIGGGHSNSNLKNSYLRGYSAANFSSTVGIVAPWNGTVVSMSISSSSNTTNSMQIRNDGGALYTLAYNGSKVAYASNVNVDFAAGDILSFYCLGSATGCTTPQALAIIRRRI